MIRNYTSTNTTKREAVSPRIKPNALLFRNSSGQTINKSTQDKTSYDLARIQNFYETEQWVRRSHIHIVHTPKIIQQKGQFYVEHADGCLFDYMRGYQQTLRLQLLYQILKSIEELAKHYGLFYLDKQMMKVSKMNKPCIWIHHQFKINFREFPISDSPYAQKIFYENIKRAFSSLLEFPQNFITLSQTISQFYQKIDLFIWKKKTAVNKTIPQLNPESDAAHKNSSLFGSLEFIKKKHEDNGVKHHSKFKKIIVENKVNQKILSKNSSTQQIYKVQNKTEDKQILTNRVPIQSQLSPTKNIYSSPNKHRLSAKQLPRCYQIIQSEIMKQLEEISPKNISSASSKKLKTTSGTVNIKEFKKKQSFMQSPSKQRKQSEQVQMNSFQWSSKLCNKFLHSTFSNRNEKNKDKQQTKQRNSVKTAPVGTKKKEVANLCISFNTKPTIITEQSLFKKPQKLVTNAKWKQNKLKATEDWAMTSQISEEDDQLIGDEMEKLLSNSLQSSKKLKQSDLVHELDDLFNSVKAIQGENNVENITEEFQMFF